MVCLLHGHLDNSENKNLVFKDNPGNMGLLLGNVQKYNKQKGYITLKLKEPINIGDTISLQNESGLYTISELMSNGNNIKETQIGQIVTIGRMKGNISIGDNIYKMSSKKLSDIAKESYRLENKKIQLNCEITIQKNKPISIRVTSNCHYDLYKDLNVYVTLNYIPEEAKNKPLNKDTVIKQISKTSSTPYEFTNININLDDNVFLPNLSILNELRRTSLENVESYIESKIHRSIYKNNSSNQENDDPLNNMKICNPNNPNKYKVSLLLNLLNLDFDYSKLQQVDNVYIPLKFFTNIKYDSILKTISNKFNAYVYMPTIFKENYKKLFLTKIESSLKNYKISGFVISNLCDLKLLNDVFNNSNYNFEIIANYTFNVFNSHTVLELKKLGISRFTFSPELDKNTLDNLSSFDYLKKEMIVYGKFPILNMNYCLLGETNKCYHNCKSKCTTDNLYFLNDRLNMNFPILPDNIQTVTTVFNSKTTSISPSDFNIDLARIDILYENIDEINNIIKVINSGKRFEGKDYTNGNLNRTI